MSHLTEVGHGTLGHNTLIRVLIPLCGYTLGDQNSPPGPVKDKDSSSQVSI